MIWYAAWTRSEGAKDISLGQAVSAAPGEYAKRVLRPGGAPEGLDRIGFQRLFRTRTSMVCCSWTATALAVLSPANIRSPFGTNPRTLADEKTYYPENSAELSVILQVIHT